MVDTGARLRIYDAVKSLVGAGPITGRLETAAITLAPLRARDFPEGPQREQFEQIQATLTKVSGGVALGDIGASVRGMDEAVAVEAAQNIVRLLYRVGFTE